MKKKKSFVINDNSINNNEITQDIVVETLIRIFLFEKKINELCNYKINKDNDAGCIIASKNLIEKYKDIFDFKSLKIKFNNDPNILEFINNIIYNDDNKKEDSKELIKKENLSKIINELGIASINKLQIILVY